MQPDTKRLPILTSDGDYLWIVLSPEDAATVRAYWRAVREALAGDTTALDPFDGAIFHDAVGTPYRLLSDVGALYSVDAQLSNAEHRDLARILMDDSETGE